MSTAATPLKPRKSPVQERSAATVEALHAAAIQVLIRDGLGRCTTTRIAMRAGVSIGSLYQYYPNRDALLAAVLKQHLEGVADTVEAICREQAGAPLSRMAARLVGGFIAAKLSNPTESKALYAVAEARGGHVQAARMRERMTRAVAAMLESAPGAEFDDPVMTATIALNALVGPVRTLLDGRAPPGLETRLEGELTLLVTGYFQAHQAKMEPAAPVGE